MIIKLQRPLAGPADFLLYSEDRSIQHIVPVDSEDGLSLSAYFIAAQGHEDLPHSDMGGEAVPLKVYIDAEHKSDGTLALGGLSDNQNPGW